jgi:pyruvate formate lyase activating enzyme
MRDYNGQKTGFVHSMYAGGMVDGPGIRTVVFLSGCHLRCKYCHNPDTWSLRSGEETTVDAVLTEVQKYRSYYRSGGGGISISGGEPLNQVDFVRELLLACRANGVHSVLDTSGHAPPAQVKSLLPLVDLLLLDIKTINADGYLALTGQPIAPTLATLELSRQMGVPVWVRYVLVPGLTDDEKDLAEMGRFLKSYANVKKIEVLPFHKHGEPKWEELGLQYELTNTPAPTSEQVKKAASYLHQPW